MKYLQSLYDCGELNAFGVFPAKERWVNLSIAPMLQVQSHKPPFLQSRSLSSKYHINFCSSKMFIFPSNALVGHSFIFIHLDWSFQSTFSWPQMMLIAVEFTDGCELRGWKKYCKSPLAFIHTLENIPEDSWQMG